MVKTSLGLDENVAGALSYLFGWVTGLVFYFLEKENKFVRFHAKQSILVFLPLHVLSMVLGGLFMPFGFSALFFLTLISTAISLVTFILWLILMLKAYQGEKFGLPIVGAMAG